jgi:hypothetical protein
MSTEIWREWDLLMVRAAQRMRCTRSEIGDKRVVDVLKALHALRADDDPGVLPDVTDAEGSDIARALQFSSPGERTSVFYRGGPGYCKHCGGTLKDGYCHFVHCSGRRR